MATVIRATNLWGFGDLIRQLGSDPAPLLADFHVPPGIENEEDTFVSFDAFVRLLEAGAADVGRPDFGLRLSSWQGLDVLGPIAVMARNATTVLDGLTAVTRYLHVHSPALRLVPAPAGPGMVRFAFEVIEPLSVPVPQGFELALANCARIVRMLGGASPRLIAFGHQQLGPDAAYQEVLDCPVRFGQDWYGFEITSATASQRIDNADPETRRIAMKYLDAQTVTTDVPLTVQTAQLARRLLPMGECSADRIAEHLAMHPRTLQRRLTLEATTCQDVIDGVRREQAERYVADSRLPFSQIAGLLGYTEQSTLNRACRRWFDATPAALRAASRR